jgi:SAM-dependent MidA family methyltransferase
LTELDEILKERIRHEGPLSFRDVMHAALYHPDHGYYTRLRGFGPDGDFITSPERHPVFGWLLGRQALDVWEALGRPDPFRILELGAGSGALAEPLVAFLRLTLQLRRTQPVAAISYTIDEPSPSLRSVQQQRLADPAFRWDADTAGHFHFIIANEVADALPVHRAIVRRGRLHELLVALDEGAAFVWFESPEPHPSLDAYFQALHYAPPEGSVVDVCLELPAFVQGLAERLDPRRGVALVMDYAASPPRDSLLTYYRHTIGSDPLIRLGEQDISAHVDLRTLVRLAIAAGLKAGATAQRGLLLNLGFQQVLGRFSGPTDRAALGQLIDPEGLGGQIAAVFLLRGLPDYRPVGAVGRDNWPEPEQLPSLPPSQAEQDFISQWREAFATSTDDS